ncbi:unnamed protein product [Brassica rapa]|uniref:Uncharacterized protein n=1 Tax=Brassica campestris TaxID=3711 RepID=A0A8D9MEF5_BRACM|nr:unnamed protein product [Brassica rapa]
MPPSVRFPPVPLHLVFPALRFSRSGRSVLVTAVAPFSGERSAFVTAMAPYSGERAALVILEGGGSFCSGCLWVGLKWFKGRGDLDRSMESPREDGGVERGWFRRRLVCFRDPMKRVFSLMIVPAVLWRRWTS